ncbi:hypothetical protein LCGC14_1968560 [marine sediment metagenome]|uniref:Uncharacterized protein n=1 Tax=marine sediment metagenome TaxID=412755 RepID=A0A0F9G0M3_9ZZZZ
MDKIVSSKIIDDAREKIARKLCEQRRAIYKGFEQHWLDKADQILALSGTTDIECPECHGMKGFVDTGKSLGGSLPGWSDCSKCNGAGVIKYQWKVSVVLENGELHLEVKEGGEK